MSTKNKVIVIGDYASVLIYKIFNFDVEYIENFTSVKTRFEEVFSKGSYQLIFVTEEVYRIVSNIFDLTKINKVVVPLPNISGTIGIGKQMYKSFARIAINSNE